MPGGVGGRREQSRRLPDIGYDDTLLAEQRHPSRMELDAVSTDHPIYIMHVSGHMGVANSRALAMAGITADSEDPPGGVIVRRPGSREPLGLLEEARMSPTRSAQDIGLRYSVHPDTPVTPMQPLQLLWSTVNRVTTSGAVIGPEQRISPMMALRAMTIDAAWQVFQEDRIGSLEPGKLADLVILSGDPLSEQEDIRQLKVLETVIGGVSVYRRRPE